MVAGSVHILRNRSVTPFLKKRVRMATPKWAEEAEMQKGSRAWRIRPLFLESRCGRTRKLGLKNEDP
jgi:hypothetical protein